MPSWRAGSALVPPSRQTSGAGTARKRLGAAQVLLRSPPTARGTEEKSSSNKMPTQCYTFFAACRLLQSVRPFTSLNRSRTCRRRVSRATKSRGADLRRRAGGPRLLLREFSLRRTASQSDPLLEGASSVPVLPSASEDADLAVDSCCQRSPSGLPSLLPAPLGEAPDPA